ncbi:MAG: hypothetical protein WA919_27105 [Coleofasciculaceae cyanobacterium]
MRKALPWGVVLVGVMGLLTGVATPTLGQAESNSAQQEELGEAEGLKATTIEGRLHSNSQTLENGRYVNAHTFEGFAGEQITIELTSDEFAPALVILDSEGKVIAGDNNSDIVKDARVTVTLTAKFSILLATVSF